jgi:hypothetical protein
MDSKKQLEAKNKSLKGDMDKTKEELANKSEKVEVMEASITKMVEFPEEIINYRPSTKVYTLFLKEQWHKF